MCVTHFPIHFAMVGMGHQQRQAVKVEWKSARGEIAAAKLRQRRVIEDIWRWHEAKVVWCAVVYVSESRLQANVVGPFGEPLPLQHHKQFLLLFCLSWSRHGHKRTW